MDSMDGYAPGELAGYFVERLQDDAVGAVQRRVFQDYFAEHEEHGAAVAVWHRGGSTPDWDALEEDLAAYIADEMPDGMAAPEREHAPVETAHGTPVERHRGYTPGYVKTGIAEPRSEVWLTSVYSCFCPEHEEEHGTAVSYLGRAEALEVIDTLLEDDPERVETIMEKGLRRGYDANVDSFFDRVLDRQAWSVAGRIVTWARDNGYRERAEALDGRVRDARTGRVDGD